MDVYDRRLYEDMRRRPRYDWREDWSSVAAQDGLYEYKNKTTQLRVVLAPLPSTRVVTIAICYNVGSKLEKNNVNGSAHILEHLLFKGSKVYNKSNHKSIWRMLNGGILNASTSKDRTEFHFTSAVDETNLINEIFTALKVEADRLSAPLIDVDVDKEAVVVRNEYERGQNSDEQRADQTAHSISFERGSSAFAVIGTNFTIEHIIQHANMEEIMNFHKTNYCPANATLVVCGSGFDPSETLRQAHVAFYGIEPGRNMRFKDKDGNDMSQVEPDTPQRGKKIANIAGSLPLAVLGFRANDGMSIEGIALQILGMWFSNDQAGAFRDLLQSRSAGLQSIGVNYQRTHGQSLFSVYLYPVSGGDEDARIDDLVTRVIERVKSAGTSDFGMTPAVFDALRNQLLKSWQDEKQTTQSYAATIVESVSRCDSPFDVSARVRVLQHLTLSDIARTAQDVFVEQRLVVVNVRTSLMKYPLRHPVCTPYKPVAAQSAQFQGLPERPRVIQVPYASAVNGAASVYMRDPDATLVSLRVHLPSPSKMCAAEASLCGMLATTGLKMNGQILDEKQLCEQFQTSGANASVKGSYKGIDVSLDVPAGADFHRLASMLKAGIADTAVNQSDFERKQNFLANQLAGDDFSVNSVAGKMFSRSVFHETGDPRAVATGAESSRIARSLDRSKVMSALKRAADWGGYVTCVAPTNAHLRVARQLFEFKQPNAFALSTPSLSPDAGKIVSQAMDGKTSCTMLLGCGIPMNPTHEQYVPLIIAVDALGGDFISRLMQEVRVKRGLTYGCNARCSQTDPSTLVFRVSGTFAPSLAERGVKACRDVVRRWRRDGITQSEFDLAKKRALDRHFIASESSARVSDALHRARLYFELPSKHCLETPERIQRATLAQCNEAIQSMPAFEDMVTVVAGALPKKSTMF